MVSTSSTDAGTARSRPAVEEAPPAPSRDPVRVPGARAVGMSRWSRDARRARSSTAEEPRPPAVEEAPPAPSRDPVTVPGARTVGTSRWSRDARRARSSTAEEVAWSRQARPTPTQLNRPGNARSRRPRPSPTRLERGAGLSRLRSPTGTAGGRRRWGCGGPAGTRCRGQRAGPARRRRRRACGGAA